MDAAEIAAINACVARGTPIIPVVEDLAGFTAVTPDEVSRFNGFQLSDTRDVPELAGLVLELIGLQRAKRKIFISYARADAGAIAGQLRLAFMERWYSVFLDSVSIRPGVLFQNNLREELADSDVVVFLDSPNARGRRYVDEELAFAGNAGLGGLQVVWPGLERSREGSLFTMLKLAPNDLETDARGVTRLSSAAVQEILRKVAEERTVVQEKREQLVFKSIMAYANREGWDAVSFLGRHIELRRRQDGRLVRLDVALGVPTSRDIERAFTNGEPKPAGEKATEDKTPEGRLVYNPLGITNVQSRHLRFFRKQLQLHFLDPNAACSCPRASPIRIVGRSTR
jgi:TIR domain